MAKRGYRIPVKDLNKYIADTNVLNYLNTIDASKIKGYLYDFYGKFVGFVDKIQNSHLIPNTKINNNYMSMNIGKKILKYIDGEYNKSYSINKLIKITNQNSFFKVPIKDRVKLLNGSLKYLGYKEVTRKIKEVPNVYILFIQLFFEIPSLGNKTKYQLCVEFPYVSNLYEKSFKDLDKFYRLPVRLFSSDPSFKYFLAYALKSKKLLVESNTFIKWLGAANYLKPKVRNPNLHVELTKHFYRAFKMIAKKNPYTYLDKKYRKRNNYVFKIKNDKI